MIDMRKGYLIFLSLLLVLVCGKRNNDIQQGQQKSNDSVVEGDRVADTSTPFVLDTTKPFKQMTPHEIVALYCLRDAGGERLGFGNHSMPIDWKEWGDEPGWDKFDIVKGYEIKDKAITENVAQVDVNYNYAGWYDAGNNYKFCDIDSIQTIHYKLRKEQGGWRLVSPMIEPHVSLTFTRILIRKQLEKDSVAIQKRVKINHILDSIEQK
ncbi:MAG TPA: hypothetical protein VMF29_00435 [Candidatus Edwardsbacteria bacterium]|nr:hypothetical protein [Candidatus Edwardsbacteria bacterium]